METFDVEAYIASWIEMAVSIINTANFLVEAYIASWIEI